MEFRLTEVFGHEFPTKWCVRLVNFESFAIGGDPRTMCSLLPSSSTSSRSWWSFQGNGNLIRSRSFLRTYVSAEYMSRILLGWREMKIGCSFSSDCSSVARCMIVQLELFWTSNVPILCSNDSKPPSWKTREAWCKSSVSMLFFWRQSYGNVRILYLHCLLGWFSASPQQFQHTCFANLLKNANSYRIVST